MSNEPAARGNGAASSFRELRVWNAGIDLAEACYRLTRAFPRDEQFGLTSQVRRAAASIPANIAEGHGRGTRKDSIHFLYIAQGSLNELETHLILAERIGLAAVADVRSPLDQVHGVGRMLYGPIGALQRS